MSTKKWIILFALVATICLALTFIFMAGGSPAAQAYVFIDGQFHQVIDLQTDGTYRIECAEGWNELLVKDGEISVSSASCPSQDCVHTPPADRGAPIVCLPHRMVIRFSAETENMDALLR